MHSYRSCYASSSILIQNGALTHGELRTDDPSSSLYGRTLTLLYIWKTNQHVDNHQSFQCDIRIKFSRDKCTCLIKERGNLQTTQDLQNEDNMKTEVKPKTGREYESSRSIDQTSMAIQNASHQWPHFPRYWLHRWNHRLDRREKRSRQEKYKVP